MLIVISLSKPDSAALLPQKRRACWPTPANAFIPQQCCHRPNNSMSHPPPPSSLPATKALPLPCQHHSTPAAHLLPPCKYCTAVVPTMLWHTHHCRGQSPSPPTPPATTALPAPPQQCHLTPPPATQQRQMSLPLVHTAVPWPWGPGAIANTNSTNTINTKANANANANASDNTYANAEAAQ